MRQKSRYILDGPVPSTLVKMTVPSVVGMLGMMIFNVVDAYFVGRLGALELAAISFTFPVVMVIGSIVLGIGMASMALFSRAAGNKNIEEERLLATSTFTLGVSISIVTGIIGYLTIKPLFRLLGADDALMPLIVTYMKIWYLGAAFMVIPMLGDSILRGLGDTFTPAFVMMTVAVVNLVLDPILIFGLGPFPAMGIAGAAVATIFARGIAAVVSILIQVFREHLIIIRGLSLRKVWEKWKALFHIGLPNSAVKAILPLGVAIFTSILAGYGHETVAGFGVATKIESLFMAVINAFGITATVFVGQNLGAGNASRVTQGIRFLRFFVMMLGFIAAVLCFFGGNFMSGLFNDDPAVRAATTGYLAIVPFGYGFTGLVQIGASILNVYHKPFLAGGLSLVQIGLIAVPAAYFLSLLMGMNGVFVAILASFVVTGMISTGIVNRETAEQMSVFDTDSRAPVPS